MIKAERDKIMCTMGQEGRVPTFSTWMSGSKQLRLA